MAGTAKNRGNLIPFREEKLNSIGFVWSEKEYNWKVWFDALKSFKDKEGRWPRCRNAEDKREVVLADDKQVLRDLAQWMDTQKTAKSNGKLIPLREEKLNEIGFPFYDQRKRKQQADLNNSSRSGATYYRNKKRRISDYL